MEMAEVPSDGAAAPAVPMERAPASTGTIYDHGLKIEEGTCQLRLSLKAAGGLFVAVLLVVVVVPLLWSPDTEVETVIACDGEHCDRCLTAQECGAAGVFGEIACQWNSKTYDIRRKNKPTVHMSPGCYPKPPPPPPPHGCDMVCMTPPTHGPSVVLPGIATEADCLYGAGNPSRPTGNHWYPTGGGCRDNMNIDPCGPENPRCPTHCSLPETHPGQHCALTAEQASWRDANCPGVIGPCADLREMARCPAAGTLTPLLAPFSPFSDTALGSCSSFLTRLLSLRRHSDPRRGGLRRDRVLLHGPDRQRVGAATQPLAGRPLCRRLPGGRVSRTADLTARCFGISAAKSLGLRRDFFEPPRMVVPAVTKCENQRGAMGENIPGAPAGYYTNPVMALLQYYENIATKNVTGKPS